MNHLLIVEASREREYNNTLHLNTTSPMLRLLAFKRDLIELQWKMYFCIYFCTLDNFFSKRLFCSSFFASDYSHTTKLQKSNLNIAEKQSSHSSSVKLFYKNWLLDTVLFSISQGNTVMGEKIGAHWDLLYSLKLTLTCKSGPYYYGSYSSLKKWGYSMGKSVFFLRTVFLQRAPK